MTEPNTDLNETPQDQKPEKPGNIELSEDELKDVSAGACPPRVIISPTPPKT